MARQVLIPIDDGSEEIEVVTIVDTLRRAGAEVMIASCLSGGNLTITSAQRVQIVADTHIEECVGRPFHLIAIPGGIQAANSLKDCRVLIEMLQQQKKVGKWYAAICASPALVLAPHGLLDNTHATCYPSLMDKLEVALPNLTTGIVVDDKKRVITAQGPGNAMGFAFKLIDALYGKDAYRPIAKQMVAYWAL